MTLFARLFAARPVQRLTDLSDRELQRMGLSRDALVHNALSGCRYS